jgi:hypothetical protein
MIAKFIKVIKSMNNKDVSDSGDNGPKIGD